MKLVTCHSFQKPALCFLQRMTSILLGAHAMDCDSGPATTSCVQPVFLRPQADIAPLKDENAHMELGFLKARLKAAAQGLEPAIFKRRTGEAELLQQLGIRVLDWQDLKHHRDMPLTRLMHSRPRPRTSDLAFSGGVPSGSRSGAPKVPKVVKSKANASGRTYTSRFRGVHQTFPTRRWEAQFRRNGKPTSLGCFDHEDEAAKAYDKMMLWCELHNTAGLKGGITNFDSSEYEKELSWLGQCSQDELIESLRSEGRKQAAHRMLRQKREATNPTTDEEPASGSVTERD